jgi:hypothetical protein
LEFDFFFFGDEGSLVAAVDDGTFLCMEGLLLAVAVSETFCMVADAGSFFCTDGRLVGGAVSPETFTSDVAAGTFI